MLKCWRSKPDDRPTISTLITELQDFLDESMVDIILRDKSIGRALSIRTCKMMH